MVRELQPVCGGECVCVCRTTCVWRKVLLIVRHYKQVRKKAPGARTLLPGRRQELLGKRFNLGTCQAPLHVAISGNKFLEVLLKRGQGRITPWLPALSQPRCGLHRPPVVRILRFVQSWRARLAETVMIISLIKNKQKTELS